MSLKERTGEGFYTNVPFSEDELWWVSVWISNANVSEDNKGMWLSILDRIEFKQDQLANYKKRMQNDP